MTNDCLTLHLDGVPVRLMQPHDLSFLARLGRVCCCFDEQDSGNLCFGLETGTERLFVKYAGAQTIASNTTPARALRLLQEAVPVYEDLRHPSLVQLRDHFATEQGYAAVFAWAEGESLAAHWAFTPAQKYTHPASPSYKHKQLPLARKLDSLDTVFAFHEFVAAQGYVAIDFYDGSLLYDFDRHVTTICDTDLYRRRPQVNRMGRMWGSSRFMSPEEFELGAPLDEVTNVYTLGATAFVLLGGERDRTLATWEASPARFEVATQATHPQRAQRYQSIHAFRRAWEEASG